MDNEIITAQELLKDTGISLLDATRLVRNILDFKTTDFNQTNVQFCAKVIKVGIQSIRSKEMNFKEGFNLYYKSKSHLRPETLRDIRTIGNRLLRSNTEISKYNFSEISRSKCESWLASTFLTSSQFNKARTMLHGLFQFALRKEWCDKNPIKLIERKKIIEKEIRPLSLKETRSLLENANVRNCAAIVGLMVLAGIRPKEAKRVNWNDIDLKENSITIRSVCSKTGGVRHVEICPSLKNLLSKSKTQKGSVCPSDWNRKWKKIRDTSGFKGSWIQDVLRHTYASYYAKYYKNLTNLQLNMGHSDLYLLRSRYVNMHNISHRDAKKFFMKSHDIP